jgi:hypothetical protein
VARALPIAVLVLASLPGCMPKLARMAKQEAHHALDCPVEELAVSPTVSTPPWTLYTVKGCGKWVRYRGTCESMRSGCDAARKHPECDGTCRLVEREDQGEMPESGR